MADSKTYLNVPYPQKDAAKALGARWDAANKKWYVAANKDLTPFAQWLTEPGLAPSTPVTPRKAKSDATPSKTGVADIATGVITQATIKDFAAYSGNEPPWD